MNSGTEKATPKQQLRGLYSKQALNKSVYIHMTYDMGAAISRGVGTVGALQHRHHGGYLPPRHGRGAAQRAPQVRA
jgi:hypothetical protein